MTQPVAESTAFGRDLLEQVSARLSRWPRQEVACAEGRRRAAVVVALNGSARTAQFIVIKRVARGTNAGHWALPGGRLDAGETATEAGLRELHEEVGLQVPETHVLGLLDDFTTTSGYVITPLVALIPPGQQIRCNPAEVHSVHPIQVSRLLHPGVPRWRTVAADTPPLLQMPLRHDMVVHAPTGAILWQFAEVALRGRPQRVLDLQEPAFTAN